MSDPDMLRHETMRTTSPFRQSKQTLAREIWPVAKLLSEFDLYAEKNSEEEGVYARLYGLTFPHNDTLNEAGAVWDRARQSWVFDNEANLMHFAEILDRTRDNNLIGLEEEPYTFVGANSLQNQLSRFLELGANALRNEELLELLLSFDSYLDDPSTMSRQLLEEFGSFGAVLKSEPARLQNFEGITPRVHGLLKAIQLTIERVLHEPIQGAPVIGSWSALLDYARARLAHRQIEEILVLYLDKKNRLIKMESNEGTIDHAPLYPRIVAAKALELFASAVIVAHNHPGGDAKPSKGDIEITKRVSNALELLEISLHDHFIICDRSHFSFRTEGLL